MPSKTARAGKACDSCRRLKTRCYMTDTDATCLRCQTLGQSCSLDDDNSRSKRRRLHSDSDVSTSVASRLDRLEGLIMGLINRLDAKAEAEPNDDSCGAQMKTVTLPPQSRHEADSAPPVLMLRDAGQTIGVHSPEETFPTNASLDILSNGSISMREALDLTAIFQQHYGRWVRFDEKLPAEQILAQISKSPLLLSSVCLIAVRHTTQELVERLAPKLFDEARHLLQKSLLVAPQSLAFFQATLILSLWSTTIGRAPLSLDSWLLTGFALQHGRISFCFSHHTLPTNEERSPFTEADYIWNHLCLAHLQYCIGTRRNASINNSHIEQCAKVLGPNATNFEVRMVAELKLYWLIYLHCSIINPDIAIVKKELKVWKDQWHDLFEQPRSQFLHISYQFAQLLAFCNWLQSPAASVRRSVLAEMLRLARDIIEVAINTTDERTRHLTDHIYHMITFSAITICRLLHKYEAKISSASELDDIVSRLIEWLLSIGLSCHAASVLGRIVAAQQAKLRPLLIKCQSVSWHTPEVDVNLLVNAQEEVNPPLVWETFMASDWTHPFNIDLDFDAITWPTLGGEAETLSASDV